MLNAAMEFLQLGGPVMIPLSLVGIAIGFIGISRIAWILLWQCKPDHFACSGAPYWAERALKMARERRGLPGIGLTESIELVLGRLEDCLTRRVPTLRFLAQISTMLGFLGTVTGMVATLHVIAMRPVVVPSELANGLFEALYTTVYGLVLGLMASGFAQIIESLARGKLRELERRLFDTLDTGEAGSPALDRTQENH